MPTSRLLTRGTNPDYIARKAIRLGFNLDIVLKKRPVQGDIPYFILRYKDLTVCSSSQLSLINGFLQGFNFSKCLERGLTGR